MSEFKLPSLGADMDEGTLLQWQVRPGDTVKRGQVVAVVDTSKAAVDVEIWQDGVIEQLLVQPGQKVPVGTVLALLRASGEARIEVAVQPVPIVPVAPSPTPQPSATRPPDVAVGAALPATVSRARVAPAARQRAHELGIDPTTLHGSGAQGAVTLADVEAAARGAKPPAAVPAAPLTVAERQKEMRRAIAAAMSRSKREIPHYYLSETIRMDTALAWLQQRNAALPVTERILPAVLQLKAVALALQRVPQLNGFYRNERFEPAPAAHIGVAIALRGGGLVAPALHDVGAKSLAQLMRELADLVQRARAGSLRSSEMSDPTITVTNLGDQGVEAVFGVIYPPQVALVGFGSVAVRPWIKGDEVQALPLLTATLAADHRVTDGHLGALFLAELRERLQNPETLAAGAHDKGDAG
jgi:pyruvate dehydrogenase E2 component (dihydrolipoamide acetyltransferase)